MNSDLHIEFPDACLTGRGSIKVEDGQPSMDGAVYVTEGDVLYLDLQYGKLDFKHPFASAGNLGPGSYLVCRGGLYRRVLPT